MVDANAFTRNADAMNDPRSPMNRRALLALGAAGVACLTATSASAADKRRSRLILLGTAGGPTPKPNRAAPATAITVGDATYIVDCGNGVARQLILAGLSLDSLRSLFITHHHSDHNADYGNLLMLAWSTTLARPVDAYGPPPLKRMTRQFLALNDYDIRTRMADEGRPALRKLIVPHEIRADGLVMQDANIRVTAALVPHPPVAPAFAYRFDCPDRSIVISGDTAPSTNLVALARGADILVHEVMHLPSLEAMAAGERNAKTLLAHLLASHTSTEQVGRIATEAGVKTLVLSHFVPGGYPQVAEQVWYDAVRPYFSGNLVVGRDLMEL
ncbi:MBL fold metallo-hydrolase [Sphingomonas colocasiae]|uniref:MBL fold metallo-hydrolase n=1 Tax=Sphingomonas colocasiae TaxID=1848973 RepID=A0ABS7PNJ7_9SPHN|nr:MBL fold metallo-hydrolase [Sphingomonas colocasiae]MBY8821609.1 MBL fold metallo-hydrolase [Sphingomonas colocasiae]